MAFGLTVLRFENCLIVDHTAEVLERIRQAIRRSRPER
jgi:very-short-patch-repair endonuclease